MKLNTDKRVNEERIFLSTGLMVGPIQKRLHIDTHSSRSKLNRNDEGSGNWLC